MSKKKLAIVLGIRPDVIRASLILNNIRETEDFETVFIWSGQHYSTNLKDIFFSELNVLPPEIELNCIGNNDAEISSSVIKKLYDCLLDLKPDAVTFLGDTNTVMGCLACAQLNIPIVHIEGCMRSYDWRMPEEKCRTVIDHLSDIIYTYFPEYKKQGISEGINPNGIVVVQNLIVDILNVYYFNKKNDFDEIATNNFFSSRNIEKRQYLLATCHRRENVENKKSLQTILKLFSELNRTVFFPASYRTQKRLKDFDLLLPQNVVLVDPIGYKEMLALMVNSYAVVTDSGTVVEETAVLGVPSLQMRKATERPQVYDCGSSVKFDPDKPENYPINSILNKLDIISNTSWDHKLGDGKASMRIVNDLKERMSLQNGFRMHTPKNYALDICRSWIEDGIK